MHTTRHAARRTGAALAAVLALGLGAPALASGPSVSHTQLAGVGVSVGLQSAPYCGIYWGSLPRTNGTAGTSGTVDNVRAGRHACFDRMVIDVDEVPASLTYDVRYVDVLRAPGSGAKIALDGGAALQIVLRAPAYDDAGNATYTPSNSKRLVGVSGWSTFRQVAMAGSFEGQTTFGLGVRARLPYRVLVLDGPGDGARLVVDVGHRW
ncbi:AMIN-like domain-containing (lipo)protein [Ornithinimicrobium cryptoxanthini]|uniref:AMIN-like domain-containing protein n=1 Tax=Ornithinimicrobium cryptoxanthini TaxID=2934161 RepID=A0ABY4YIU9_9MICO|nr:hypothetical protein [Ornithinimicrobium cryptoxanthini]USQ76681.1 hypothetical protein NF557_01745 [Ornithinimicrobium cryptoxanthini]